MISLKQKTLFNTNAKTDNEIHYVYLLANGEHIGKSIYKIGKTTQKNLTRLSQYPKESVLYIQMICLNCHELELELINMFSRRFRKCHDLGNEYFEGEIDRMMELFIGCVTDKNQYYNFELKKENHINNEMDIDYGDIISERCLQVNDAIDEMDSDDIQNNDKITVNTIGDLCDLFKINKNNIPTHETARKKYISEYITKYKIMYKITLPSGEVEYITNDDYIQKCTIRIHESTNKEIGLLEYNKLSLIEKSKYLEYPKYTSQKMVVVYSPKLIK
jgi:hypothetical protein